MWKWKEMFHLFFPCHNTLAYVMYIGSERWYAQQVIYNIYKRRCVRRFCTRMLSCIWVNSTALAFLMAFDRWCVCSYVSHQSLSLWNIVYDLNWNGWTCKAKLSSTNTNWYSILLFFFVGGRWKYLASNSVSMFGK